MKVEYNITNLLFSNTLEREHMKVIHFDESANLDDGYSSS